MRKYLVFILTIISVNAFATQGALPGVFSVSATKKVQFSQGNLQYQASTKTWRFAANQYDYIGTNNKNISSTYSGWIDLFGYGTSGYGTSYPYKTDQGNANTYTEYIGNGYGGDANITGTNYDWGKYCSISNGGNQPGLWRTLSYQEWNYVIFSRTNAANLFTLATVNGVKGAILLPDTWSKPSAISIVIETKDYTKNKYTLSQWNTIQSAGAIFLPAGGIRNAKELLAVQQSGHYWSGSFSKLLTSYGIYQYCAYQFVFGWKAGDEYVSYTVNPMVSLQYSAYKNNKNTWTCNRGASVRLVQDAASTTNTITFNANGGLIPTGGNMGNTPTGHTTTLSADRKTGTVVVTYGLTHFQTMKNDCPIREGYTFDGWWTDPTGGTQVYDATGVCIKGTAYWNTTGDGLWIGTSDLTVYAHWKANTYTVTFNANGGLIPTGGNMGNSPAGYVTTLNADRTSGTVTIRTNSSDFWKMVDDCPTLNGYIFDGWWTDPIGGTQVYDATGVCIKGTIYWDANTKWIWLSDVTFYAHWIRCIHTISTAPDDAAHGSTEAAEKE